MSNESEKWRKFLQPVITGLVAMMTAVVGYLQYLQNQESDRRDSRIAGTWWSGSTSAGVFIMVRIHGVINHPVMESMILTTIESAMWCSNRRTAQSSSH